MQGCLIVQRFIALDMEGVVTPEIWIAVAEETGLDDLRRTTRDEPDYQKLMEYRISILTENEIGLTRIQKVISDLDVLAGAKDFLDLLRSRYQVTLLSDTFEEFAGPLMEQLGRPHLLCHRLVLEGDRIVGFEPRTEDAKRKAVQAYQSLGYHVTAFGDSHNDVAMLHQADAASLFRAPPGLVGTHEEFPRFDTYAELAEWIDSIIV